jgi:hypothetical protein
MGWPFLAKGNQASDLSGATRCLNQNAYDEAFYPAGAQDDLVIRAWDIPGSVKPSRYSDRLHYYYYWR